VNRYSNPDKKNCRNISCCESIQQSLMFLHLLFIRITVSIHNNLCFYIYFLSGLLYRFTTIYTIWNHNLEVDIECVLMFFLSFVKIYLQYVARYLVIIYFVIENFFYIPCEPLEVAIISILFCHVCDNLCY
jgi:hypothetical protein